ncbi:MAG TPA: amino-acid N-acetyltransferase [Candidatus Acidoferrum sp.]|nr:amino-acid N-acetyltransferase [Candidatus Acidoferrum sp.]
MDLKQYVNWFRQSTPYINAYRGKVFVVMLPGEAIGHDNFWNIAHDITLLNSLGAKLVLCFGARSQVEAALTQVGIATTTQNVITHEVHNKVRVTDVATLDIIKQVVGKLRIDIEAAFSMGLINSPMHGADLTLASGNFIVAKPFGIHNGIDFGLTGEVRKVEVEAIRKQLDHGNIVLMPSLGYSLTGEVFNLTVEDVACSTAIALKADKLLIYGNEAGILDQDGERISKLSAEEAQALIRQKIAENGGIDDQLRNLELGVKACIAAVKRAQVISYEDDGALLIELFTRDGIGTLITAEQYEQLRQATIKDVGGILELIEPLEQQGVLVHRSRERLEAEIEQFSVITRDGMIIACAALYPQGAHTGELACLATHPDYRNNNRGQLLLEHVEKHARRLGLTKLFVLTTHSPHWFVERGFVPSIVDELPERKKSLYNYQRNSKIFVKLL